MRGLLHAVLRLLRLVFGFGWVRSLKRQIRRCRWRRRNRRESHVGERGHSRLRCESIPERLYRRPDPLIYSQSYLMGLGMGVTWDNPDIQLFRGGTPVESSKLLPDTEYRVVATIWNGSTEGAAIGMPVRFSYLDFGIGAAETAIGQTIIDLPVKAAPGHPATTEAIWRTPTTPGHYCLKVTLVWSDDANPANNVGQENTNVGSAASPARFDFIVRNPDRQPHRLRLRADAYALRPPSPCPPPGKPDPEEDPTTERDWPEEHERRRRARKEQERRRRAAAAHHAVDNFPVPEGWTVQIHDAELALDGNEQTTVRVDVEPPPGFSGRRPINVNAFDEQERLVGGVTLYVER